jgi:hypothetical protein
MALTLTERGFIPVVAACQRLCTEVEAVYTCQKVLAIRGAYVINTVHVPDDELMPWHVHFVVNNPREYAVLIAKLPGRSLV